MLHQLRRLICLRHLGKSVQIRGNVAWAIKSSRGISTTRQLQCLGSRDHIKVELYPEDEDPILESIYESSSMQQVFDTFDSISPDQLSPKYSSQSLVTLWDLQKFIFRVGRFFHMPSAQEFETQDHYIQTLRQHPTLRKIVSHVLENCEQLEDEPLAASLLCFWRLKFDIRGEYCQRLLNELSKRKSTLALPALSRLCVIFKGESIYGYLVLSDFAPVLHSYILNMRTDEEVRLVSIAMRAACFMMTQRALNDYILEINRIFEESSIKLEPATLTKILAFLFERQLTYQSPFGADPEDEKVTTLSSDLFHRAGRALLPHVDRMEEMDIMNLSKFIEFQKEPSSLTAALADRVSRLVQEAEGSPSADLMACVQPRSIEQKLQMVNYLKRNLTDLTSFARVHQVAFRILKKGIYDQDLFDRFWTMYVEMLERNPASGVEISGNNWDDHAADDELDEDVPLGTFMGTSQLRFLKFATKYLAIRVQVFRAYRHPLFESYACHQILETLKNYQEGKCVIGVGDYAKAIAFLVVCGYRNLELNQDLFRHFRVPHLIFIYRAVTLSRKNCYYIVSKLYEQSKRLLENPLTPLEYVGLARVNMLYQRAFDMSPVFEECLRKAVGAHWCDGRTAADLLNTIFYSGYNLTEAFERTSGYICHAGEDVSPKCAIKFAEASFLCGTGWYDALPVVARVIEKHVERIHPLGLLNAMIGLCYHGVLSRELVHKIFSVGFLDEIDKQIQYSPKGSRVIIDLRDMFMQLNRAVCIDMPEATVPWFHEKYCQELASVDGLRWTYVHHEVLEALTEILGPSCVAKNIYSPYYYPIDFLVHFDDGCNPLPVKSTDETVAEKLAVIVHHPKDYTSCVRRLKGKHVLKRRHLEILGYRVIDIDPLDWNSMLLSEKGAKNDYLQECIFSN